MIRHGYRNTNCRVNDEVDGLSLVQDRDKTVSGTHVIQTRLSRLAIIRDAATRPLISITTTHSHHAFTAILNPGCLVAILALPILLAASRLVSLSPASADITALNTTQHRCSVVARETHPLETTSSSKVRANKETETLFAQKGR